MVVEFFRNGQPSPSNCTEYISVKSSLDVHLLEVPVSMGVTKRWRACTTYVQ